MTLAHNGYSLNLGWKYDNNNAQVGWVTRKPGYTPKEEVQGRKDLYPRGQELTPMLRRVFRQMSGNFLLLLSVRKKKRVRNYGLLIATLNFPSDANYARVFIRLIAALRL